MIDYSLTVTPYTKKFKSHFVSLNLEWLEHFFWVEEHDKEVLNQCEKYILEPGGHIFFFLKDQQVIGTYAFMKMDEGVYEFTKMAVNPIYRGKGIGNQMMVHSLMFAKQNNWRQLIIYTSSILSNAIHLYKKYGYKLIPMETDKPYERGDVKLKFDLK